MSLKKTKENHQPKQAQNNAAAGTAAAIVAPTATPITTATGAGTNQTATATAAVDHKDNKTAATDSTSSQVKKSKISEIILHREIFYIVDNLEKICKLRHVIKSMNEQATDPESLDAIKEILLAVAKFIAPGDPQGWINSEASKNMGFNFLPDGKNIFAELLVRHKKWNFKVVVDELLSRYRSSTPEEFKAMAMAAEAAEKIRSADEILAASYPAAENQTAAADSAQKKIHIIHIGQFHNTPHMPLSQHERIARSQHRIAQIIRANQAYNRKTLVLKEGLTEDLGPKKLKNDAAAIIAMQLAFPMGIPNEFSALTPLQKEFLCEPGAPYVLFYLGELSHVYKSIDPEIDREIYSIVKQNPMKYPLLIFDARENQALHCAEMAYDAWQKENPHCENPIVYVVFGGDHNFQRPIDALKNSGKSSRFFYGGHIETDLIDMPSQPFIPQIKLDTRRTPSTHAELNGGLFYKILNAVLKDTMRENEFRKLVNYYNNIFNINHKEIFNKTALYISIELLTTYPIQNKLMVHKVLILIIAGADLDMPCCNDYPPETPLELLESKAATNENAKTLLVHINKLKCGFLVLTALKSFGINAERVDSKSDNDTKADTFIATAHDAELPAATAAADHKDSARAATSTSLVSNRCFMAGILSPLITTTRTTDNKSDNDAKSGNAEMPAAHSKPLAATPQP